MPDALFQVHLTVRPTAEGKAEIVPPDALADMKFSFVAVKDGGEEAIVRLSAPADAIKALERRKGVTRLTPKHGEQLRARYPAPRIRRTFRAPANEQGARPSKFALDSEGNRVVDTFQTV